MMKNFEKISLCTLVFLLALVSLKAQEKLQSKVKKSEINAESNSTSTSQESNINAINGGMPNRISMNVTVGKQTQGATFGEKVNSGKINVTLVDGGCVVLFSANEGYRVNTSDKSINELSKNECRTFEQKIHAGLGAAGGALAQGAFLVGGAQGGGGSVISAAVSSVGSLAGGPAGGAAQAMYARTGKTVQKIQDDESDVILELQDGEYELSFVIVGKATSGVKDTLKTQVCIGFSLENGVLKTKHDTAKNSVGNIR